MATRLEDRPRLDRPQDRSLGSLISDLAQETAALVRKEVELAKTEMSGKIDQVQSGAISAAAGGAILYAGFLVLLLAVTVALDALLDNWIATNWLAPLIVGVVVLLIGYIMLKSGQKAMKGNNLVPRRTIRSLQQDARFAQREATETQSALRPRTDEQAPSMGEVR